MRLYVDSNVLLSYIKRELGRLTSAQMYRVEELIHKCALKKHLVVLSDLAFHEIETNGYLNESEVVSMLRSLGVSVELIRTSAEDASEARAIESERGIHYPDSLHVTYITMSYVGLAVKSKSDAIITWNLKEFNRAKKLLAVCGPEGRV